MSNDQFFWKIVRDVQSFQAIVAWIKRGFKRKPRWEPRTQWIKEILRRRDEKSR